MSKTGEMRRKIGKKTRGKKAKAFRRKEKRKKSGQGGKYYLEDGTYEENENFESWAKKLRRMWKKVNAPPKSRQISLRIKFR